MKIILLWTQPLRAHKATETLLQEMYYTLFSYKPNINVMQ